MFAFFAYLIFWALNIFFLGADYIINQHAPFFLVLRFVLFRVPQAIPMAFPFASLFAGLLAMGRVMGDNEVTAMRTSGIPVWRIALTPLIFGFAMFLLAYGMNEYVTPASVDISTRTFYQIIYHTDALPVEPQFFRKDPDTGNVFYVNQVLPDNKTMEGVQIFKPARYGLFSETLQAKTATVQDGRLALHDVIDTRYNSDGFMTSQQKVKEVIVGASARRDRGAIHELDRIPIPTRCPPRISPCRSRTCKRRASAVRRWGACRSVWPINWLGRSRRSSVWCWRFRLRFASANADGR